MAAKGKEKFSAEMNDDYNVKRAIARRIFKSLRKMILSEPRHSSRKVRDPQGDITISTTTSKAISSYTNSVAVLIGIDKYKDVLVPNLYAAKKDVYLLRETIRRNFCGFHKHMKNGACKHCDSRILTLINEEATSNNIVRKTIEFLDSHKQGRCDRLLFFYAGHGCVTQNEWHLLSYDHTSKRKVSGVTMTKLIQIAKSFKFHHILFVLDSCYSGHATPSIRGSVSALQNYLRFPSVQVLAATRSTSTAMEVYDYKSNHIHGLLTTALTNALTGDVLKKRVWMPLDVLFLIIRDEIVKKSEHQQTPLLHKDSDGQIVFWTPGKMNQSTKTEKQHKSSLGALYK